MKIGNLFFACCLAVPLTVSAETIILQDGSSIQGKVLSMSGGQYQIQTQSMGTITLKQSQIRSISAGGAQPAPTPSVTDALDKQAASAVQSMQSSMVNDPGIMSSIMMLQKDPDMQAVLQDPEVMRAIQSFDLQTLQNHPKIKKLMQNRNVKSITSKVQ